MNLLNLLFEITNELYYVILQSGVSRHAIKQSSPINNAASPRAPTILPPVKPPSKKKRCFLCAKRTGLATSYMCRYELLLSKPTIFNSVIYIFSFTPRQERGYCNHNFLTQNIDLPRVNKLRSNYFYLVLLLSCTLLKFGLAN